MAERIDSGWKNLQQQLTLAIVNLACHTDKGSNVLYKEVVKVKNLVEGVSL